MRLAAAIFFAVALASAIVIGVPQHDHDGARVFATKIAIGLGVAVALLVAISVAWTISRRPGRITFDAGAGERLRAPDGRVVRVPLASVDFALRDGYKRIPKIHMRAPDGRHVLVDEDEAEAAARAGFWAMTSSEVAAAEAVYRSK